MALKNPIYHEFDLNATSGSSRVISLTHTDDAHVDTIELCVKQQGAQVDITGATVVARMVLHSTRDVLLNDNVSCAINSAGNILIPFDNAAIQSRKGIVKIEVNITRTPDILTLQLPLWVKINGSILDDATVDPHSEGTIPELLKDAADALEEATQALEDAKDYDKLENKPQINSHTLSGNKTSDELGLQKKLTAGTNITIANDGTISASGGITNYDDLTNKPKIRVPVYEYDIYIDDEDVIIDNTISLIGSGLAYTNSYGDPHLFLKNVSTASLNDNENFLVGKNLYSQEKYDFNTLSYSFRRAGMWEATALVCTHAPSFITNSFVSGRDNYNFLIIHYFAHAHIGGGAPIVRCIVGKDINKDFRIFYQYIRLSNNNDGAIISQSNWVELTNGSQIVSGIVNQNGTITFTDSDGNTFTTTGSSVIGFSPTATVTQTASGATVSITDSTGTTTANISNGADGQDYVLTAQDKSDIADIVLSELPTTQGVLYGNTSN